MRSSTFPRLDREVSKLGFGAFGLKGVFGGFDEKEAIDSMHHCWSEGVNLLDTARHYGESEAIVGRALKAWSGERPFIATKAECIGPARQWAMPQPVEQCFPRGHITREAETSLRTLGVEQIDLFQMHLYWPNWGTGGYWLDELETLREQGKVASIGVSMPDQRHDAALTLVTSGRIDAVQTVLNIFDPTALDCLVPLCREHGVAVLARCVLDEGGLTGSLSMDQRFGADDFRANYFDQGPRDHYLAKVEALRRFVPEHAGSLAALALKFATHHPGVTTALSSMDVREHADANVAAMAEEPLGEEVFEELRCHHRWIRNFYCSMSL